MPRRGAWKQEILLVVLFLVILTGLAVLLTLRDSDGKNDRSYIREELGQVIDNSKPISNVDNRAESSTQEKAVQGKDVPKDEQKEITNDSGLKYIDQRIGEGDKVKIGSNISVYYKGTLKNGEEFDGNIGKSPYPVTIGAGRVIKGWEEGLLGMKAGGKRKLIIPHRLGYGEAGNPPKIPPRAELIFEIEVVKVTNK